jgi:type IV secretory pathway TraG/TraD family ATPase VirD4
MHIDIWGPRTGKTTSRAIPVILSTPGAALVTSNKRDIVDGTREVRAVGGPVWVFDPQSVALEEPAWWWNPLSYVTDEVRPARLADHFASGSRAPEAKTDAYFDPAGQDLLAGLLLAAALDNRPITQVHTWLTRPTNDEAVDILEAHGFTQTSNAVAGRGERTRQAARGPVRHRAANGILPHQPPSRPMGHPARHHRQPATV